MSKEETANDLKKEKNVEIAGNLKSIMVNEAIVANAFSETKLSTSEVVVQIENTEAKSSNQQFMEDGKILDKNSNVSSLAVEKSNTCESCGQQLLNKVANPVLSTTATASFRTVDHHQPLSEAQSTVPTDLCRICHCEAESGSEPLLTPCHCKGSLAYVHHSCLQRWIQSSGHKHCELCGFHFVMKSRLKPFMEWETLKMTSTEKRKVWFSVFFHVIAIVCVVWSLYVLVERTTHEIEKESMQWPFWTKLAVVVVGLIGGLTFMYIQCKTYCDLFRRLMSYNKIVCVEDRPIVLSGALSKTSQLQLPTGMIKGTNPNCEDKNKTTSVV